MIALLFSLLSTIPGMIGQYFNKKAEIEKIKLETAAKIEEAKANLALEVARGESDRASIIIGATSAKFKYLTFCIWFCPFAIGIICPPLAKTIFENMLAMPPWYTQSVVTIMFTIWGISVTAPVVGSVFAGLGEWVKGRREYKLEKINRKAYYEAIRKIKGTVSDSDVKSGDAILDLLDAQNSAKE